MILETRNLKTTLLPVPLFLFLTMGIASAQATHSAWNGWQPAMTPQGLVHPSIQYRWRRGAPCVPAGCPLAIEIRNTSSASTHLRCAIYFDTAPSPTEDETRPVIIDAFLKSFGGMHTGTAAAGDTTRNLIVSGTRVTGVVVEIPREQ